MTQFQQHAGVAPLGATEPRGPFRFLPSTSCVKVVGFRVDCAHRGHFEICSLHIPHRPFISFESTPGRHLLFPSLNDSRAQAPYGCPIDIAWLFVRFPRALIPYPLGSIESSEISMPLGEGDGHYETTRCRAKTLADLPTCHVIGIGAGGRSALCLAIYRAFSAGNP